MFSSLMFFPLPVLEIFHETVSYIPPSMEVELSLELIVNGIILLRLRRKTSTS